MKKSRFVILISLLCVGYAIFLFMDSRVKNFGENPVMSVPNSTLKISTKAKDTALLKGVKVLDKEDGDISSKAFIESISEFDENNERLITYAVFDSDDNIVRSTRKLSYTDYEKPKFDIKKPLTIMYYGNGNYFLNHISAYSSVDGDITSNVSFITKFNDNNTGMVRYTVTDSCGVESSIELKVSDIALNATIDIELYENLIYVKKGKEFSPLAYVKSVNDKGIERNDLIRNIDVYSDYDNSKAGMYEVVYELSKSNGESGATKLVVIVE